MFTKKSLLVIIILILLGYGQANKTKINDHNSIDYSIPKTLEQLNR